MTGIRHLHPVPPESATGLVAQVYAQARRDFGLLPPIPLHSPDPPLLAGMWAVLRETLVAGQIPRPIKEAAAAAISRLNRCPYCVDAHSLMLVAAGQRTAAREIVAGRESSVQDEDLRRAVAWAAASRSPGAPELANRPFPEHAAELVGTAAAFHYINRMAHVFLPDSPFPLPPGTGWAKGLVMRLVAGRFAPGLTRGYTSGDALSLLPEVELPAGLPWARSNPAVAGAYARFASAVDSLAREALSTQVRDLVVARVDSWNGADPGLGRGWLEEAVAALPEEDKPAGRLTLLTALASYQVDDGIVAAFRVRHSEDRHLLGAVSWASFIAARRVASWLS
ncbi:MAG TPA: carboxymuconolactone decarboxylase family protein [Thermoanaerobaculia bacterium]|nr:carboxymuconolactone decarboxylase family protein [Thermoanaerobaculia bacterium]